MANPRSHALVRLANLIVGLGNLAAAIEAITANAAIDAAISGFFAGAALSAAYFYEGTRAPVRDGDT